MNDYQVVHLDWTPEYNKEITEIYRMLKDQERRIFDLAWYSMGGDVMDYLEGMIREGNTFAIVNGDDVCAFFLLDDTRTYKNIIIKTKVHTAVRKKYWGRESREIMRMFKAYLLDNYNIKKIVAEVPQCGYGVIKLLKDIGFKHEGTLKQSLIFKDKKGLPKFYDELIYSFTNEDI